MDEKDAIAALGALAQETRLALFRLLVTCGPAGLPAGVIAERLSVQPSSLSFHLAQLVHAGLITQRRLSRHLIYSAEYGTMNALLEYLTEIAADAMRPARRCVIRSLAAPARCRRPRPHKETYRWMTFRSRKWFEPVMAALRRQARQAAVHPRPHLVAARKSPHTIRRAG